MELEKIEVGAPVLVFSQGKRLWSGPHRLINLVGETVVVQMPRVRKIIRTTCVKSSKPSVMHTIPCVKTQPQDNHLPNRRTDAISSSALQEMVKLDTFRPNRISCISNSMQNSFVASRSTELFGLSNNGTFTPVSE